MAGTIRSSGSDRSKTARNDALAEAAAVGGLNFRKERSKMTNPTGNGGFKRGRVQSRWPPELPADIREAFKAKAPEALEVLERGLQSDDERIAMQAAQAILDRGYGKPAQTIDANINEGGGPIRYYAELPEKAESVDAWAKFCGLRQAAVAQSYRG